MIRYRCPHCAALTVAHERRIGQSSVCKACLKPHQIPADPTLWLSETGELLNPPAAAIPVDVRPTSISEIELPAVPFEIAETNVEPVAVVDTPPPLRIHENEITETEVESVVESATPAPVAEEPSEPFVQAPEAALELTRDADPIEEPSEPFVSAPEVHVPEPIRVNVEREPEVTRTEPLAPTPIVFAPEPITPEPIAPRVTHPIEREPWTEPVAAQKPEPESVSAVATATIPSQLVRDLPVPAPTPAPRVPERTPPPVAREATPVPPRVTIAEPVQLQTQVDITVALTAALSSRMRPPPAPRRDLRPSTAAWMLLTGAGVACVLVALFGDADLRWAALAIGATQILIGYVWIVRMTHARDPQRGLLCAIPPVTLFYLTQHKYARLRPLRFVLTGAVLAGLSAAVPALANLTQPLLAKKTPPPPPEPVAESKLAQLRTFRDQRDYKSLIKLLEILTKTDPIRSADAKDRDELATELKSLCQHQFIDVRTGALAALFRWDADPNAAVTRELCLAALRAPTQEERVNALELLPRWKDAESARAAQSLIGRSSEETHMAKTVLKNIGGPPAEQAALALLKRSEDQATRLTAIDILETVGGTESVGELRAYATATNDTVVRTRALGATTAIEERMRKPAP
ncbi:hypothetical protein VT84_38630 [Gemmata sp. SH-PL17]|uniref:hypothetical protein n=1 Tax=Gemmata sp. SH-PL17 TaxID=1630693 RepID=UPI00078B2D71|nr:hypothetical protein [Gemmata sp. SH-PL17]AMV30373.1 hypothetical protein VT84_38630 [Gemmata sp. SH-PL17]